MDSLKEHFIEFALDAGVLKFGDFTLKSGRQSPYFFNAGLFNDGEQLAQLGYYYAATLEQSGLQYDSIFGPAYKGITLACATAMQLAASFNNNKPITFNRKEVKDHGEGGQLVGAPLKGRVVIIDDVITAGTAFRESVDIIQANGAEVAGVMIALNRQEKGQGEISTIQEIEAKFGIPVISIISLEDVIEFMQSMSGNDTHLNAIKAYQAQYGE